METLPHRFSRLVFQSILAFLVGNSVHAAQLTHFTPQGEALQLNQATANFDTPVRPLGDLAGPAPLTWACDSGVKGKARWVDVRTWAVEFAERLPAGVSCEFKPVPGLKDTAGQPLKMAPSYRFNTGGPWATNVSAGYGGGYHIDEEAVFLVHAAGDIDFSTVEKNAWCEADGISEKIPVKLLSGAEKKALFEARGGKLDSTVNGAQFRLAALRCARRLPNDAAVRFYWGSGIKGTSGLATGTASKHEFRVRPEFSVKVTCQRENAKSGCNPFSNIPLYFTAPVMREDATKLRLVGPKGKEWRPEVLSWGSLVLFRFGARELHRCR